jgi:hypothetical protein
MGLPAHVLWALFGLVLAGYSAALAALGTALVSRSDVA